MRVKKLEIIFQDEAILVCRKPAGIATQSARAGQQDMVSLIKNERARKGENPYVGLVHRLDQPVEGVMVFAKDQKSAANLSKQVASRGIDKFYLAVVAGRMEQKEGILEHMLIKDGRTNLSRVADSNEPDARFARLSYQVLDYEETQDMSLVRIKLDTGRHHQIRVQFSAIGHPLMGDQKYNQRSEAVGQSVNDKRQRCDVALCSHKIGFVHPMTKKQMEYEILPQNSFFAVFDLASALDN